MKKRIVLAMICGVLSIGVFACGNKEAVVQEPAEAVETETNEEPVQTEETDETEMELYLKTITAETAEYKGVCGADAVWYYQDNVLVVKGEGVISAPSWKTEEVFDYGQDVKMVLIGEGITEINADTFSDFGTMLSLSLPVSLEAIEDGAFSGAEQLVKMVYFEEAYDDVEVFTQNLIDCGVICEDPFGILEAESEESENEEEGLAVDDSADEGWEDEDWSDETDWTDDESWSDESWEDDSTSEDDFSDDDTDGSEDGWTDDFVIIETEDEDY